MPELNTQLKQETYARLSDAIEAGWQDLDQLTTGTFGSWHLGRLVAVCALGAASYAAGAGDLVSFEQPFPQAYAELTPAQKAEIEALNVRPEFRGTAWETRWEPSTVTSLADAIIVANDQLKLPKAEIVALVRRWGY
jgi:hypothetical protein